MSTNRLQRTNEDIAREKFNDVKIGDIIEAFQMEQIKVD